MIDTPSRVPAADYWLDPPPRLSDRCLWWLVRVSLGWRPNKRIRQMGYYSSADFYGVYIWEWLNILGPAIRRASRD